MLDWAVAEREKDKVPGRDDAVSTVVGKVYEIDPLTDPRWPILVATHPQASVFHTRAWLSALQVAYGYRPKVLTTCPPQTRLTDGIVFCEVRCWLGGRRLVSLPFSDHCEPLFDDPGALAAVLSHARHEVEEGRYMALEIRPRIAPHDEVRNFQPKRGAVLHRLDLSAPTDQLFHGFHKDCIQRKIRRAERENVMYEEGNSEDRLNEFYRLMTITRRRHGLPPQPLQWFRALIVGFGPNLKIRIARKNGAAIASIITLSHLGKMVYKYGCSDASANKYGGMPLLFWRAIQEAKANGQNELDMGRTDLDDAGLSVFKERWGCVPIPLTYWRYPIQDPRKYPAWQKELMLRAVSACPDSLLQFAGRVLYRYMG